MEEEQGKTGNEQPAASLLGERRQPSHVWASSLKAAIVSKQQPVFRLTQLFGISDSLARATNAQDQREMAAHEGKCREKTAPSSASPEAATDDFHSLSFNFHSTNSLLCINLVR